MQVSSFCFYKKEADPEEIGNLNINSQIFHIPHIVMNNAEYLKKCDTEEFTPCNTMTINVTLIRFKFSRLYTCLKGSTQGSSR